MTGNPSDKTAVIAGLGLRLGSQPSEGGQATIQAEDAGRVFVTELISGGAAERSNLLRLNDEILHVDHVETAGRSVVSELLQALPAHRARQHLQTSLLFTHPHGIVHGLSFMLAQNDVKTSILGTPGTSVRIGIRCGSA